MAASFLSKRATCIDAGEKTNRNAQPLARWSNQESLERMQRGQVSKSMNGGREEERREIKTETEV